MTATSAMLRSHYRRRRTQEQIFFLSACSSVASLPHEVKGKSLTGWQDYVPLVQNLGTNFCFLHFDDGLLTK